jgi:hypothetical protein
LEARSNNAHLKANCHKTYSILNISVALDIAQSSLFTGKEAMQLIQHFEILA